MFKFNEWIAHCCFVLSLLAWWPHFGFIQRYSDGPGTTSDCASLWRFQLGLGWRTHRSEFSASSFSLVSFPFPFFLIFKLYIVLVFSWLLSYSFFFSYDLCLHALPSCVFFILFFSYLNFYFIAVIIFYSFNFALYLKSASVSPRGRPHCTSFVTLGAAAAQRLFFLVTWPVLTFSSVLRSFTNKVTIIPKNKSFILPRGAE